MTPPCLSSLRYRVRADKQILHRALRVCLFSLLMAAAFFCSSLQPAKALSDELVDLGFSFDLPDGWSASVDHGHYYLINSESSKLVSIVQTAEDPMPPMDAPGTDLKIAQSSTAGPFSALGHLTLAGVDFIVYDAQQVDPKHHGILYSRVYNTEANGYGIAITTSTLNGPLPENDPEIMHIINTIAFTQPPQLPASYQTVSNNAAPTNTVPTGGKSALIVGVLVLAVAGILIVLGIALVAWLVFRRKKALKRPPI